MDTYSLSMLCLKYQWRCHYLTQPVVTPFFSDLKKNHIYTKTLHVWRRLLCWGNACEFFKESCLNTVTNEWRLIKGEHRKRWGRMTQITIYQFAKLDTYLFTDIIFFLCCMLVSNYSTQCNFSSNLSKAVIMLRIKVWYVSKKIHDLFIKSDTSHDLHIRTKN